MTSYCDRCGGETGRACRDAADCDLNMLLLADEVSPEQYTNRYPEDDNA